MSRKDFMAGYVAARKEAYNPGNVLMLDDRHAEIAARAIEIFKDDAMQLGYDLGDRDDCEFGVAEAVAQAADELGVELTIPQERELIGVVVKRLRGDGVIAKRRASADSRKDFMAGYMAAVERKAGTPRSGGSFYDKLFGEGEKVDERLKAEDADGREYEIHIYERSTPGTWGQANFDYDIYAKNPDEFIMCSESYFMAMEALRDNLNAELNRRGLTLTASKTAGYSRELLDEFMDYADGHPMLSGKDDDYRRVFFKGADEALQWAGSVGKLAAAKQSESASWEHFQEGGSVNEHYKRQLADGKAVVTLAGDGAVRSYEWAVYANGGILLAEGECGSFEDGMAQADKYIDEMRMASKRGAALSRRKKISRKKTASDGWNAELCEYLIDALDKCEELAYEVKNARRGSYCRNAGDTYGSLGAYASRLGEELANAGEELMALYGNLTSDEIDDMD